MPNWVRFVLEGLFIVGVAVIAGLVHLSTIWIIVAMGVAYLIVVASEFSLSKAPTPAASPADEIGGVEPPPLVPPSEAVSRPARPSLGSRLAAMRTRKPPEVPARAAAPVAEQPHVRVLARDTTPAPEPAAVRPAAEPVGAVRTQPAPEPVRPLAQSVASPEQPAASPPEPTPAAAPAPEMPEPEPEPRPAPQLESVPPPAPEPAPQPAPRQVVTLPDRGGPREWNIWDLERLSRDAAGRDVVADEERNYLLMYLREFANADGVLPADFDGLVRDSFGELVGR
jgi:hypothetical protein